MRVLGLDTATPATAVGLWSDEGLRLAARDDPRPGERPGHTTRLLDLAEGLLAQAGMSFAELDRIAVGLGPGTFTGLRIGLATAHGLARSRSLELVGVPTLHALAHRAAAELPSQGGLLALIDARRGEVFAGLHGPDGEALAGPLAVSPRALGAVLGRVATAHGLQGPWRGFGDGALRYGEELEELGVARVAPESPLHRVDGLAVCELGAGVAAGEPGGVLPIYGRAPDAERARAGAAAEATAGRAA